MKKDEIMRKRNLLLVKEVEELKDELERQKEINSSLKTDALFEHIENIKKEFLASIEEIDNLRTEYQTLIDEMKEFRKTLIDKN